MLQNKAQIHCIGTEEAFHFILFAIIKAKFILSLAQWAILNSEEFTNHQLLSVTFINGVLSHEVIYI